MTIKRALFILLLGTLLVFQGASKVFAELETRTSPNYLILLVHGINSSSRVFVGQDRGDGKGINGSDLTNEPPEKDDFGDLKGYLENTLGLDGYVYSYTFSERDGKIANQGVELGKSDYNNPAAIESKLNYVTSNHLKNINSKYTKIKTDINHLGNSWIKQAREDFKEWYANKHSVKVDEIPESVIPSKYIIIAHSMGGLAAREYIFSDYYNNKDVSYAN